MDIWTSWIFGHLDIMDMRTWFQMCQILHINIWNIAGRRFLRTFPSSFSINSKLLQHYKANSFCQSVWISLLLLLPLIRGTLLTSSPFGRGKEAHFSDFGAGRTPIYRIVRTTYADSKTKLTNGSVGVTERHGRGRGRGGRGPTAGASAGEAFTPSCRSSWRNRYSCISMWNGEGGHMS